MVFELVILGVSGLLVVSCRRYCGVGARGDGTLVWGAVPATLICLSVVVGAGVAPTPSLPAFSGHGGCAVLTLTHIVAVLPLLLTAFRDRGRVESVTTLVLMVVVSSVAIMQSTTALTLVVAFEVMSMSAMAMLVLTSKSDRVLMAFGEMYVWAMVGSCCFIGALTCGGGGYVCPGVGHLITPSGGSAVVGDVTLTSYITAGLFLGGFVVKVPLWPCGSWLIRAHVEASTEFSIYLSGFLVKFGVLCVLRVVGFCSIDLLLPLYTLAIVGVCDATVRLYTQTDLKRIVAMTTIIETNWLVFCLVSGVSACERIGVALIFAHCVTTSMEFYTVECIYRRFHTRAVAGVHGVAMTMPALSKVVWLVALTTIGIPGTILFFLKLKFLVSISCSGVGLLWGWAVLLLLLLPVFFMRLWATVLGGNGPRSTIASQFFLRYHDMTHAEACLLGFWACLNIGFGVYPLYVC